MPATTSYRLRRRDVDASVRGLLLRYTSQEVCFFFPFELVLWSLAITQIQWNIFCQVLMKINLTRASHDMSVEMNPSGHGLHPPDTSEWKKTSAHKCVIEQ
jgi:hypothetical protein